ncbi:MAG TPA: ectonucleotide pyrophosphatase/phosphodiesterase [Thermoanaerobaculia bacterium]|nr:ectonucleotide pyrophosphatase/phosphodiesterase [Thermoanaerobaculia bacterium]
MRHPRLSIVVVLLAVFLAPLTAGAEPLADHVVLISVDGFRPDFYLEDSWAMPMVRQMAREGAKAEGVRGVFPSVTYPSHTTIVTGALPARHGIYYNTPFEEGGQTGRWYWEEEAIKVETLFEALRKAGGTTAAISWPVTVGAPIDWVVPEVWSLDPESDRLAPMREGSSPGLWRELEENATGKLTLRNFSAAWMNRDDTTGAAAAYLLETKKPALLALHLLASDHFQHEDGRRSDRVLRALGAADRAISALVEAAERGGILERTAFVITGDHGFVDVRTTVAPNVWLVEAGLMTAAKDRGPAWKAAFLSQGGSAFLHLRDPRDRATVDRVRRLLQELPPAAHRLFRVVEREELAAVGANPEVPLALAAFLGVQFTSAGDGEAFRPGSGGQHGYFPHDFPEIQTGFVGWGAGFRRGATAHVMGLEDVAPLIARILDVPFTAPDGIAPLGLLELER